jgi:two-component system, chemotaxis family, protein-glutamate methylesterase/glutaminase
VISVLVVDDSVVVRRLIVDALTDIPDIQVVGTAANGRFALGKIDRLKPDIVTMDVEMPEMDGLTAVREVRKKYARLPVIMFSALTASGAAATLDALAAGATDYVTKPSKSGSIADSIEEIREQLVPRIYALSGRRAPARPAVTPLPTRPIRPVRAPQPSTRPTGTGRVDIVAIGSSTGGPEALAKLLPGLPADFPVPVVMVQHMPPVFTRMFAERLNRSCALQVVEATDGLAINPGMVVLAPGDRHLTVERQGTSMVARLNEGPPENSCRPAVDVLFRSVAKVYGDASLGVVLTGMGRDGRNGSQDIRNAGGDVVAQDEATSVVWGMPGAVVNAGLANSILPLSDVAAFLNSRINAGRLTRSKVVT